MNYFEEFFEYLKSRNRLAKNSLIAYRSDLNDFLDYIETSIGTDVTAVTEAEIASFLMALKEAGKTTSTINRKLSAVRGFFNYMYDRGYVDVNPARAVKAPKIERKDIKYLTLEEIEHMFSLPPNNIKGWRDKAILELMYATGIRANELISANLEDVNTRIGFFSCTGENGKPRVIPMGLKARVAIEVYLENSRSMLLNNSKNRKKERALFLNAYGARLTRQGLWKIFSVYGKITGLGNRFTPKIIRNSFAVHMVQNGADIKSLQVLMGHEDPAATQVYMTMAKNRIKDVYDRTHPRA